MKRTVIVSLAIICIMLFCNGISVVAAEYNYCPYCGTALVEQGEHGDHWYYTRVFKDSAGAQVTCIEAHNIDRIVKICPQGHGVVYTGEWVETVTHSLGSCPYQ